MKTSISRLCIIACFCMVPQLLLANSRSVQLKKGQELIYEWKQSKVFDNISVEFDHVIRYSLFIDDMKGDSAFITGKMLTNKRNVFQDGVYKSVDYSFPVFSRYPNDKCCKDWAEEVFIEKEMRFVLDLKSGICVLKNGPELFLSCQEYLYRKGFSDEEVTEQESQLTGSLLKAQMEIFVMPFLFSGVDEGSPGSLKSVGRGFNLKLADGKSNEWHKVENNSSVTGQVSQFQNDGLLSELHSEQKFEENDKQPFVTPFFYSEKDRLSTTIRLVSCGMKRPSEIVVCGHIENPFGEQIILRVLNKPWGQVQDIYPVRFDSMGNFRTKVRLLHDGLVTLAVPDKNGYNGGASLMFYAVPGDSIHVKAQATYQRIVPGQEKCSAMMLFGGRFLIGSSSDKVPAFDRVVFSGDHAREAGLIQQFSGMLPVLTNVQWFKLLQSVDFDPARLLPNELATLKTESGRFVYHELLNFVYMDLVQNAIVSRMVAKGVIANSKSTGRVCVASSPKGRFKMSMGVPFFDEEALKVVVSKLDTLNILRQYNPYGVYSRGLADIFVMFKKNRLSNFNSIFGTTYSFCKNNDDDINFFRYMYSGYPLYALTANAISESVDIDDPQWVRFAGETIEMMEQSCNDQGFVGALRALKSSLLNWDDEAYVPPVTLLDLNHQQVLLSSYFKGKPVILCASDDWSVGRYEMDENAKKLKNIDFVYVNEGKDFDSWKEWCRSAGAVANQVFLSNDTVSLRDLFNTKLHKFIVYDRSGIRIGTEDDVWEAVVVAQRSLVPKEKEMNKSTLRGIIFVLGALLLLALVAYGILKFRLSRKLRQQVQVRRLRELQMSSIRAQMNPHFLFNSLNSVQNLVQQNKNQEAHTYLSDFAGLIRKILHNSAREEVALAEELETLECYLKLERLRFDFNYRIDVDPVVDLNHSMLPALILQPLAENAILHGLQNKDGEKELVVRIFRQGSAVCITIEDNGVGIQQSRELRRKSNGLGVKMCEERIGILKEKYGGPYSFRLIDLFEGGGVGTRVEIIIPEEQ